ncbi:unnamed protein product [Lactuca saligna]|uniref:Uncharacterized protein n=1 Tax=Lactuca saligna TaxID=75948 RepID=A0AA35YFM6_LACSI|nr:unnamed protein product [Lactuca saligna]
MIHSNNNRKLDFSPQFFASLKTENNKGVESLVSPGEKLTSPSSISSNQATKRQKLEIGYLRKVAQLKHRTTFMHKIVKKVVEMEGNSNFTCNKTTTPQKPKLVTEEIAKRLTYYF